MTHPTVQPKGPYIAELEDGVAIDGCYLLTQKNKAETRQGKPYLKLKFQDSSGVIEGRLWDNAERFDELSEEKKVYHVVGRVSSYNDELQVTVTRLDKLSAHEVNMMDFLPRTQCDVEAMLEEMAGFVADMQDPYLRGLLQEFLADDEFLKKFRMAPAAKAMHHVFLGGLLEHTLSLFRLCRESMKLYPHVNADMVMTGLFLHDVGKVDELSWDGGFDYTDIGRLVGHITIGVRMLEDKAARVPGFPDEHLMHLTHIILSHHGQLEFGSPKLPQTLEAMIVHYLDDLDAKIQSITAHVASEREPDSHWSKFHRLYERYFYQGDLTADRDAPPPPMPTGGSAPPEKRHSGAPPSDAGDNHAPSLFNKMLE